MRLWVFSDLHLDPIHAFLPPIPDADVCVVAGDVLTRGPEHSLEWLSKAVAPHMPVVFVAGNHEYYGGKFGFDLARQRARELRLQDVHFLDDSAVVLDGVRFLGSTLWTDFELDGSDEESVTWAMYNAAMMMNDFDGAIVDFGERSGKLQPQRTKFMHEQAVRWLDEQLKLPFNGQTIVVTHHAPHPYSVHERFKESLLNPAFCSDLAHLFVVDGPELWVHGHMHDRSDYTVGNTRVVCNPCGYMGEDSGFDPGLVLEV